MGEDTFRAEQVKSPVRTLGDYDGASVCLWNPYGEAIPTITPCSGRRYLWLYCFSIRIFLPSTITFMSSPVSLDIGKDIAGMIGVGLNFIALVSLCLISIVCIAMCLLPNAFTKYGLIAQLSAG